MCIMMHVCVMYVYDVYMVGMCICFFIIGKLDIQY